MTFKFLLGLAFFTGTLSHLYADGILCETCSGLSCILSRGSILKECPDESDSCITGSCNSLILTRGCSSTITTPNCPNAADLKISSCTAARCDDGRESVANVRASNCVQCNQKDNKSCSINAFALVSTPCTNGETQCYTKVDNGLISRGCLNQLSEGEQSYCSSVEFGENCAICSGNGCNRDIFPSDRLKCHQCNSKTDPSCNTAKSTRTATFCEDYSQEMQCLTIIKSDQIQRMCIKSPADQCNDAISCTRCSTNGCNNEGITNKQINQLDQCPSPPPTSSSTTARPPTTPNPNPSPAPTTTVRPTNAAVTPIISSIALLLVVLINFSL